MGPPTCLSPSALTPRYALDHQGEMNRVIPFEDVGDVNWAFGLAGVRRELQGACPTHTGGLLLLRHGDDEPLHVVHGL